MCPHDYLASVLTNTGAVPTADGPEHSVNLPEFYISRFPVTNNQYAAFVAATNRRPPFRNDRISSPYNWNVETSTPPDGRESHPVVLISWYDAAAFCKWFGGRLPTEGEWEKAARGTSGGEWPWGNEWQPGRCNTSELKREDSTPVDAFSPRGDSSYGVSDMAGNVWEWCSSLRDPYPYENDSREVATDAYGQRVIRGGEWGADQASARCAFRNGTHADDFGPTIGFRIALDASSINNLEVE